MKPWFALGWQVGPLTGWGQFGAHFARTLHNAGYKVILPPGSLNLEGVLPLDRPLLQSLVGSMPEQDPGWLCMAIGNAMEERPQGLPGSVKVAGVIFCEDTGAIDSAKLNAYDVIVAGSRWTERVLREKGVERVVLCHQGYDGRVFFPAADSKSVQASAEGRPLIFSGGKLEFRKGQDIVVEAFKRFRQTPEGKDAILVTAWDNAWPQTMDGIWLSGYVKGVPTVRGGRLDVTSWLVANGLPAEAVIDCGRLSPPELAVVMRSCTVGVFPNRAESGNNLVLVEAIASGLPVITSQGHGHEDVVDSGWTCPPVRDVPADCRLYRSVAGWTEVDPQTVAATMVQSAYRSNRSPNDFPASWSWDVRGPAMAEAIVGAD